MYKDDEIKDTQVVTDTQGIDARPVNAELAMIEEKPSAEVISKWKGQYGDVYEISSESEELPLVLYFRKPSRQHLSRFIKSLTNDALRAQQTLVADTLIFPDMDKLQPLFTEKPGLIIPIGTQLQEIVGTNNSFLAKRL